MSITTTTTTNNNNNNNYKKKKKKNIYIYIYIYIYREREILFIYTIEIYILPYPRGVEFSGEEVIVLPLANIASLFVWIEVSATIERMYVNNINCDS